MLIRTQHAAISVTPADTPLLLQFQPYPEEEGWYWGDVEPEVGALLCSLGGFQEILTHPVPDEPFVDHAEVPHDEVVEATSGEDGQPPDGETKPKPRGKK